MVKNSDELKRYSLRLLLNARLPHVSRLMSRSSTGERFHAVRTMSVLLQPWQIPRAYVCGLVNERQQQIIEFKNAQIQVLLEQLGKK